MPIYGWIAGTVWETLPMSVDARVILVAGPDREAADGLRIPPLVRREKFSVGAEFRVRLGSPV